MMRGGHNRLMEQMVEELDMTKLKCLIIEKLKDGIY